ncbi:MAG: sigma-70 family RNA polymerase sigma factor [Planctomycetes bacterium]|nr:sigma-70 family RNA polymerase sigma factor [Planctomycetota bacterium]
MQYLLADRAPAPRAQSPSLSPAITHRLRSRGQDLARGADETSEQHRERLETALMALFRDGRREEDFHALYDLAGPALQRRVLMSLRGQGGRLDPVELCQDVFVNVYRYASSFRDDHGSSFRAWSQAICRNLVRRHLGARRAPSWQALPEGVGEPADLRVGPAACASLQEERASLTRAHGLLLQFYAAAFEELSPRDREALTLVEVEGKSYAEACELLGVGMSNMKMIMFRARKRIRARLDDALAASLPAARLVG